MGNHHHGSGSGSWLDGEKADRCPNGILDRCPNGILDRCPNSILNAEAEPVCLCQQKGLECSSRKELNLKQDLSALSLCHRPGRLWWKLLVTGNTEFCMESITDDNRSDMDLINEQSVSCGHCGRHLSYGAAGRHLSYGAAAASVLFRVTPP